MYWFKKHPDFFRAESRELNRNSNYKELYQRRDELFISHGYIVVRLDSTIKYPILICYPAATPYALPIIYPLKRELTEKEVEDISSNISLKIPEDAIEYYFQYRHQNGGGALCFLEWEGLDDGGQFYGIHEVLKRVTEWYKGHTTGNFPLDSEEVEFYTHFTRIHNKFRLLYPETFVSGENVRGEFYATLLLNIPKDVISSIDGLLYSGTHITGVVESGLSFDKPVNLFIGDWAKTKGIKTSTDLFEKVELVNGLVEDGFIKKGFWFKIDKEPHPFETFRELIEIIGDGTAEEGKKKIGSLAFEEIKKLPNEWLIAIQFPNRKGELEFQAFIIKKKATVDPPLLCSKEEDRLENALHNYEAVEAVFCEKFTENTFFQRNSLRADRNILGSKKVNLLGLGAIGSEISDCLNKAGIGNLYLVDNQILGVHNPVRHLAGLQCVGLNKVDSVAKILREHNIFSAITPIQASVTRSSIVQELDEDSVTVSSIADDNTEGFVNEIAIEDNKTVFYVRALRGGKVGRIIRVIPGVDACLNCLRLHRNENESYINIPADLTLPIIKNECNNPIIPASAADLKLIASIASRLVIDFLQDEKTKINHWIWTTEAISGTSLDQSYCTTHQNFEIHSLCQYCNDDQNTEVYIDSTLLKHLQAKVVKKAGIETGGVLAGYRDEQGNVFITHASDAGPKAVESRSRFEKDIEFCQNFLDSLLESHEEKVVYLGEWHSHPNANNRPSATDLMSLSEISTQKEYLTDRPTMIIFSSTGSPSCTVHPAGKLCRTVELKEQDNLISN